ncbi:rRNA maturation RNase YbeY [Bacillus spongiae]|uniref:Endoribonuclease YbeY n=1 Tax=Bacillus spongiae TaxID=2683610 RepID=A0ABU8H919_9BACI
MSLQIDFVDETKSLTEGDIERIENLLFFAAEQETVKSNAELSVTFVSNERIHEINKEYRHKDRPTDVISFAMEEMGEGELEIVGEEIPRILGDIIISVPKAKEQAIDYGHSFSRELGFLALHGFLHLLGYDHMTETDEKAMFSRQKDILEQYGLERI